MPREPSAPPPVVYETKPVPAIVAGVLGWYPWATMSALPRKPEMSLIVPEWQGDVTQLLDEAHLIAWSEFAQRRTQFAVQLGQFLGSLRDAEVCVLYGKFITDLESFCYQLERAIPGPTLERRISGPSSIVNLLRERPSFHGRSQSKFRFYVWHDADVLLKADSKLFGRILDAMAGVSAEAEFVSDDLLMLHRVILVGSSILDVYADDPRGQFQSWFDDGQGEPFWKVVTGLEAPSFLRYRIDALSVPGNVVGAGASPVQHRVLVPRSPNPET